MLVREAHFFLLKKQLVSIFVVPSSSKFQIRDHARLLKQELQSSSTCSMFGWSNELVRPPFFHSFPFFLFMEWNRLIHSYLSPHEKITNNASISTRMTWWFQKIWRNEFTMYHPMKWFLKPNNLSNWDYLFVSVCTFGDK